MDLEEQKVLAGKSDHDLLIETVTIVREVKKGHENHLEHHRKHEMLMLSITITSIFTAIISILTAVFAIAWKIK